VKARLQQRRSRRVSACEKELQSEIGCVLFNVNTGWCARTAAHISRPSRTALYVFHAHAYCIMFRTARPLIAKSKTPKTRTPGASNAVVMWGEETPAQGKTASGAASPLRPHTNASESLQGAATLRRSGSSDGFTRVPSTHGMITRTASVQIQVDFDALAFP